MKKWIIDVRALHKCRYSTTLEIRFLTDEVTGSGLKGRGDVRVLTAPPDYPYSLAKRVAGVFRDDFGATPFVDLGRWGFSPSMNELYLSDLPTTAPGTILRKQLEDSLLWDEISPYYK